MRTKFFNTNEPISAVIEERPVPPPPGATRKCEFCGSGINANGEVLQLSDRARILRDLEATHRTLETAHATLKAEHSTATTKVEELSREVARLTAELDKKKKNFGLE